MATQEEIENSNSQNENGTFEDLRILDTDTPEVIKEKGDKLIELNQQSYARTKKAEGFVKGDDGKWTKPAAVTPETKTVEQSAQTVQPAKTNDISTDDLLVLIDAKIPREDIDEVKRFAKFNNISIGDALADITMQSILERRQETRGVAAATHTGGGRRGTSAPSVDDMLSEARKGNLPDSAEDIAAITRARKGIKSK